MSSNTQTPCASCPWRTKNQGTRHKFGFYTKRNLRRLWSQLRRGGRPQSCHMTDPSHPDHVSVGAKPGATARECPGSVIVVLRELERCAAHDEGTVSKKAVAEYLRVRPHGLTRSGFFYWTVKRIQLAGVAFLGGPHLPPVDTTDPEVGLGFLEEPAP